MRHPNEELTRQPKKYISSVLRRGIISQENMKLGVVMTQMSFRAMGKSDTN